MRGWCDGCHSKDSRERFHERITVQAMWYVFITFIRMFHV